LGAALTAAKPEELHCKKKKRAAIDAQEPVSNTLAADYVSHQVRAGI